MEETLTSLGAVRTKEPCWAWRSMSVEFMSPSQACLVIHRRERVALKGPGIEARGWKKRV